MRDSEVSKVMAMLGKYERNINGWRYGPISVYRGGGIAGNGHTFWIRLEGDQETPPVGPCRTAKQLRSGLRGIIVDVIAMGNGLLAAEHLASSAPVKD